MPVTTQSIGEPIAQEFSSLTEFEQRYLAKQINQLFNGTGPSLHWRFDGDGEWKAVSNFVNEADPEDCFYYKIEVCEDGTFDIKSTDPELKRVPRDWLNCFDSLALAKAFCGRAEAEWLQAEPAGVRR